MLKQLINLFIKKNGRSPNAIEMLQLKFKAAQQSGKGQVIQFPRDRIKDWRKAKPQPPKIEIINGIQTTRGLGDLFERQLKKSTDNVTELDDPLVNELARTETLASPTRIKQGFSTQSKLNSWSQNQQWVKDFIGRKNREFNSLSKADQTEVLEMFETQIKKHGPKEPKAYGGLAGMLGERTGYKDAKFVGDPTNKSPYNIFQVGFGPILDDVFEEGPNFSISEKDLEDIKDSPKQDIEDIMFRIFREDPEKFSKIFLEVGKDKAGIGWKKQFAGGGLAGMLGEPTYTDENHRVPLKDGYSPGRRKFLKGIAALATVPVIGKFFKWAKPLAKTKSLTQVPIKNAEGMPVWFSSL